VLPSQPNIQEDEHGVTFVAKIVPGSSKTAVVGILDGMVKVKIAAPPEKGKANQCLIAFLAKKLGVKKNAIHIVTGQTNPVKHVQIGGVSADALRTQLHLPG
jgi:uncharacterized protein (TIGR00251 family)